MVIIGKLDYFVYATFGIHSHTLYSIDCLLDTGVHPNVIAKGFLVEHWTVQQQAARNVYICSSSKDSIDVIVKINLYVRIGDSLVQAIIYIVDKLEV